MHKVFKNKAQGCSTPWRGEKFGLFEIWWMEMQPCIMNSKIVSTVGLEPCSKLKELLGSKDDTAGPQGLSWYRDVKYKWYKPWNAVTFFCLHKNIKYCPDKMRSLRINGTNAHDIQVQNNADIYKRLIFYRNRRSGHHNFHVFLTGKTARLVALSFKIKRKYSSFL